MDILETKEGVRKETSKKRGGREGRQNSRKGGRKERSLTP
jgi:hypothetical protein